MQNTKNRRLLQIAAIILLIFLVSNVLAEPSLTSPFFSYNGVTYLNVTHSGLHGEKYLLNKQLSTVQISLDLRPVPWGKFHSLFIYNRTPTPVAPTLYFDEAYFEFSTTATSTLVVGKKWLGFSANKTDLIYKPLTKALGQTNETVVGGSFALDKVYSQLTFFQPHSKMTSILPLQYSFNLGVKDDSSLVSDVGIGYISSIADSSLLQYNSGFGGFLNHRLQNQIGGIALYANLKYKPFSSYLSATSAERNFSKQDLSYQNHGAQPSALSIQSSYDFKVKHTPLKFIIFYEESFQALALLLPKRRAGTGLNIYVHKNVDFQFQIFKDYSYADNIQATGLTKKVTGSSTIRTTGAFQLVFRF